MQHLSPCEHGPMGMRGIVEIKAIVDAPGSLDHGRVVAYHRNMVVTRATEIMSLALAGDPAGKITTVVWGTGDPETGNTLPPHRSDTGLQNERISSVVLDPVAYPTSTSVIFASTLEPGRGTGYHYSEVGLKAANGTLFARFTFPPTEKWAQIRLTVAWQIIFVLPEE